MACCLRPQHIVRPSLPSITRQDQGPRAEIPITLAQLLFESGAYPAEDLRGLISRQAPKAVDRRCAVIALPFSLLGTPDLLPKLGKARCANVSLLPNRGPGGSAIQAANKHLMLALASVDVRYPILEWSLWRL